MEQDLLNADSDIKEILAQDGDNTIRKIQQALINMRIK